MNQINHQPELLDLFLDELIKDPQAAAPADLDTQTATAARAMIKVEQNLAATVPAKNPAQAQIWQKVLTQVQNIEAEATAPQRPKPWSRYALAGLGLAAALALAFLTFSVLLLPNPVADPARQGNTTTPSSTITPSQNITATFVSEAGSLDGEVRDISWAPNGETLAIALSDNTIHLWSRVSTQINTILDNQGNTNHIAWSPDGRYLAATSEQDTRNVIHIWKADGTPFTSIAAIDSKMGPPNGLAWSPDSKTIATSSSFDIALRLWTLDGNAIDGFDTHIAGISSLTWAPDSKTIAISSNDKGVWLWSPQTQTGKALANNIEPSTSLAWSADSKIIATAGNNHTIKLWDISGKLLKTLTLDDDQGTNIKNLAWSPDGKVLAVATDKTKTLWNSDGKLLATIPGTANILRWSPGSTLLAAAVPGKSVYFYSVRPEGEPPLASIYLDTPAAFNKGGYLVAWRPDGKQFVSASRNGDIVLWNADGSYKASFSYGAPDSIIYSIAWSPDSTKMAIGVGDNSYQVDIFEWTSPPDNSSILSAHWLGKLAVGKLVTALAWSPDGKTIATNAAGEKNISLWAPDGTATGGFEAHTAGIESLAWSPDGKTIATGADDKVIWLWSPETNTTKALLGHTMTVNSLAWSPDGKTLASGSYDGTIKFWTSDGKFKSSIDIHIGVNSLSWSPDGKTLAATANDSFQHLFDANGNQLHKLKGSYNSAAWSPDGSALVMANLNTDLRYASMQIWRFWK